MAAEAVRKAAEAKGYQMKVETQGSVGAQNPLNFEEIGRADAVIIAAYAFVDKTRFAGKRLYETGTKEALHSGQEEELNVDSTTQVLGRNNIGIRLRDVEDPRTGNFTLR